MNSLIENYFGIKKNSTRWKSWIWQQQNAVRSLDKLLDIFPLLEKQRVKIINESVDKLRFQVTPYMLSLIETENNIPKINDPIWQQFIPCWDTNVDPYLFNMKENWELEHEMITPILHHKYYNRANFRIQNNCLGYCMYCFEAKRVLDLNTNKGTYRDSYFSKSLQYIKEHPEIEEIVISGGEPLTLSNEKLEPILASLSEIPSINILRIQTRALSHNPFRIDNEFIRLLNKYNVAAMGIHISHPREISETFVDQIKKFSSGKCRTILLPQIPLLKDINDDAEILIDLLMTLYKLKLKPYYLIHMLPYTLGSKKYRTSVLKGVELINLIKRKYSNPALPEYIIVHKTGKHTVPLDINGSREFQYLKNKIRFKNWHGKICYYDDSNY